MDGFSLLVQSVLWPQITHDLHITYSDITQAQAANLVGLAMGCVMFIPFTKKYGRRPAYVLSTLVLTPVAWWVSRMSTAGENYATNLLFGLAGAINETAVQMSVRLPFFPFLRERLISLIRQFP